MSQGLTISSSDIVLLFRSRILAAINYIRMLISNAPTLKLFISIFREQRLQMSIKPIL